VPKNCSTPAENNSQAKLRNETIGDFTTPRRVIPISALAMVIGLLCAGVALPDRLIDEFILFWTLEHLVGFPGWQSLGNF
jgi:hypothetical protein